jgi:hypothetical protein
MTLRSRRRVLFILKHHEVYGGLGYCEKASGLKHSAEFIDYMLKKHDIESKVVIVIDNNYIDREVTDFKPDVCIIEALWVVPEKFDVLKRLHPTVKWVVRIHSEIPFLSNEGIAVDWLRGYLERGIVIAPNSQRTFEDLQKLGAEPVYLPNYYPDQAVAVKATHRIPGNIHVGCFGAIRPLKNQLNQAVAAIRFANKNNLTLFFHINDSRIEDSGSGALKNLTSLFSMGPHQLIKHQWQDHTDFLLLLDMMDINLSVSFSETFSIVTADAVSRRVPIVTSQEVIWADDRIKATPTDSQDIAGKMGISLGKASASIVQSNIDKLHKTSVIAERDWLEFLDAAPKKKHWIVALGEKIWG